MEEYQKRMIEEFKELNERTTKLERFPEYPELTVGEVFKTEDGKIYKCIGYEENGCPVCEVVQEGNKFEDEVRLDKQLRKDLDVLLQKLHCAEKSRERSLSITKIQEAIMWLGMDLKRIGTPNPYPESKDPSSLKIEPTADGLKM